MKNKKIWLIIISVFILGFNIFLPHVSASTSISEEWHRTCGEGERDVAKALVIDSSDNIYVAGWTDYIGTTCEECYAFIRLIKYNSLGMKIWNRTWNASQLDYCNGIALDSSDNIYLGGTTRKNQPDNCDMCLIKYDGLGTQIWNRTWGGDESECCYGIAVDSSDYIYLGGRISSYERGHSDLLLVKYDSSGNHTWSREWGGNNSEHCSSMAIDSLNNIYLAGDVYDSEIEDRDMLLLKYDNSGEYKWNITWGGDNDDNCYTIEVDSSDNIYIAGTTRSFGAGDYDVCLVKYNSLGIQQWNHTWGRSGYDRCYAMASDSSDNIYLAGSTGNGSGIIVFSSLGLLQLNCSLEGNYIDLCYAIALDSLENIYLAGETSSIGAGGSDMILMKISQDSDDSSTTTIPGYDSLLMICLICTVSVFLIKKRRKSLK